MDREAYENQPKGSFLRFQEVPIGGRFIQGQGTWIKNETNAVRIPGGTIVRSMPGGVTKGQRLQRDKGTKTKDKEERPPLRSVGPGAEQPAEAERDPGRPRARSWLQVRVHGEQKSEWVEAAEAKGMKLSEWVKKTLTRAAGRETGRGREEGKREKSN